MTLTLLWEITLGSWLTAALILLVRQIFGKWLTSWGKALLWLLLLLRLIPFQLLPVRLHLESPVTLMRYIPDAETTVTWLVPEEREEGESELPAESAAERKLAGLWPAVRIIWLAGAGAVFLAYLILYLLALRKLRSLPPCGDLETEREYLKLKQLCRPGFNPRLVRGNEGMLGGFFHPTLVIPAERVGEGAAPILLHEMMHYQGGDIWLTLLYRLFCALYWFDPAVWFCFWLFRRDEELACDQRVLDTRLIAPEVYSRTLLEEYELRGSPDPMPLARFGAAGVRKRIRDIRKYPGRRQKPVFQTALLAVVILFLAVLSPVTGRSYGFDRSIPAQVGYPDADSYIQALQPSLGAFGMTYDELVAAGYLAAEEGVWLQTTPAKLVLSLRRELAGEEHTVYMVFRPTLFTGIGGKAVLTEIQTPIPPLNQDNEWKARDLGAELLLSSPELEGCHARYSGDYDDLFHLDTAPEWGLLDQMDRDDELEAHFSLLAAHPYQRSYEVRCSPVTLGDCLSPEDAEILAARLVESGMARDIEEGQGLVQGWHLCGMLSDNMLSPWRFLGMGIALYETRPVE
ncbi:MAG: M56 family metallopeptidase [Oscillospiraceae bacterium]|nr:M56 family metallopeptidase [Oscillospiraceae bacterium]